MADKTPALSTLASNIKQGVDSRLKELHTSMPGIIESFDSTKQTASIQPAVKRIFVTRDGDKEILTPSDLPILINVPIVFPRGGGFSLTFPVKKGDECLLNFCERSIDNWHQFGTIKVPGARRFHSLSDAVAFVGLSSLPNKIPDYDPNNMEIKKDDGSVSIKLLENGNLEIHSDSDIVATCKNIEVTADTQAILTAPVIKLNGNTTIDGTLDVTGITTAPTVQASSSLTVGGKEMSGHTHIGSATAPSGPVSNTGAPV